MENEELKTIMIFGVSSFVGSNLAEFFKRSYRVIGTYFKHPIFISGVTTIPCDVMTKEEVQLAIFTFKPDFVIYSVGLSSVYDCSKAKDYAEALNTIGLFNVVENCQRYKSQVIYISSSMVFGGVDKLYIESDIPDSLSVYGKTKSSAEFFIQRTSLNYLIFRVCALYGRGAAPRQMTTFELLQNKIENGDSMLCDNNVFQGFLDPYYLGMAIKLIIEKGVVNRLFQISSTDFMTFYDFAKLYCKVFKQSDRSLSKGYWSFPIMSSSTSSWSGGPIFCKMDMVNLENYLNTRLPTVEESLKFTFQRFRGTEKIAKGRDEGIVFI